MLFDQFLGELRKPRVLDPACGFAWNARSYSHWTSCSHRLEHARAAVQAHVRPLAPHAKPALANPAMYGVGGASPRQSSRAVSRGRG